MPNHRFLTAYVDLPFLEGLFREKPEDLSTTPDDNWPMVWQNVYRFLQQSANIVIDAEEQVIESGGAVAGFLLGGGFYRHIDFQPGVSSRFTDPGSIEVDKHAHSLFLLESNDVPTTALRKRGGLLFLELDDLTAHWPRVLEGHSVNVLPENRLPGRKRPFRWDDLQAHATPLNALVVADKYAYKQFESGTFEENLGELLLALLPHELDHPVHVTLVTDLKESVKKAFDSPSGNEWPHPKEIHDRVQSLLEENRPKLDTRLGVVGYGDHSHKDRFIFTNYGLFTSNDSFSFFDGGELEKETLVTYLPSSTEGAEVVKPRLERMAKYLRSISRFDAKGYSRGPDQVLLASGDDKNRLLNGVG